MIFSARSLAPIAVLVLAAVCLPGQTANAEDPPADAQTKALQTEAAVLQYIDELDDDSIERRDVSEKMLIRLGVEALPTVRTAFESGKLQGEQEVRLARVFRELQSQEVQQQLDATTVTLSGDMSLEQAAAAVGKQTGNPVKIDLEQPQVVPTDFENIVFWEAIDTLCDASDLDVDSYASVGEVVLHASQNLASFRARRGQYNGPFRIEATSVNASRSFTLPQLDSLRIGVQIAWEPRLRPLSMTLDRESLSAICDNGVVLEILPGSNNDIVPGPSIATEFEITLRLPPRDSQEIERLNGNLEIELASSPVEVRFTSLQGELPISRQVGDLVASVEATRTNGPVVQVDLLLKLGKSGMRLESFRNWLQLDNAFLIDPAGEKVPNLGWQTYSMNEQEVGVSVNFQTDQPIEKCQFIFAAPVAVIEHEVEFLLEGIPLP